MTALRARVVIARRAFASSATAIVRDSINEFFQPLKFFARLLTSLPLILLVLAAAMIFAPLPSADVYRTDAGRVHTISWQDGNSATLSGDTRVLVTGSMAERRVEILRGEVFFRATSGHTVWVSAADVTLQSADSVFWVGLKDALSVEIRVGGGHVTIESPVRANLSSGQVAKVTGSKVRIFSQDDVSEKLVWKTNRLQFERATLSEAVAEFNRRNNTQLVIDDVALERRTVGGVFSADEPEAFALTLRHFLPIRVHLVQGRSGKEIHISSESELPHGK
jgi:transmembrane sensor